MLCVTDTRHESETPLTRHEQINVLLCEYKQHLQACRVPDERA